MNDNVEEQMKVQIKADLVQAADTFHTVEESNLKQDIVPAIDNVKVEEKLTEKQQRRKALLPFAIISISYLLYTMTDGSVRMIVLLHAYNKKFTAMEVFWEGGRWWC
jgi:hypothetical protein